MLVGKQVIAVVNFPPKQIGPFVSEVLTLGLADSNGHVVLVSPDHSVVNGERLLNAGLIYALSACFIWGLIFIVPLFMQGYGAMEIALGTIRHFMGRFSVFIFFKRRCRYPIAIWLKALYFSLASSFAYYTFVILAVRWASPAICALILGLSPITIALYGNWKEKECSYRSLIIPSVLILAGLVDDQHAPFEQECIGAYAGHSLSLVSRFYLGAGMSLQTPAF